LPTDVVRDAREVDGAALAAQYVRAIYPDMRILLMTGYAERSLTRFPDGLS
jgi:ActR/RegA family two-component response regulator